MSDFYPCCNDCGALEAKYDKKFGCYLCDECWFDACEEYEQNIITSCYPIAE